MNLQDVLKLPAGRELDLIVAERVIGWRRWKFKNTGRQYESFAFVRPPEYQPTDEYVPDYAENHIAEAPSDMQIFADEPRNLPRYSTSLEAAWQVVEKMRTIRQHVTVHANNGWGCSAWNVREVDAVGLVSGTAETAPLAICRAALKATWTNHDR